MREKRCFGLMASPMSAEYYLDYAREHGIRHIEIDLKKKHSRLRTFSRQRIDRLRTLAESDGVSLSLHTPFNINLCSPIPPVRYYYTAYLRKCIQLAAHLNATHITLHLGSFQRAAAWDNPRDIALERLCGVLKKILPACEKYRVRLALENVTPTRREVGFSFLGDSIGDLEYIFRRLESPFIRFCLDIGHANTHEGVPAYIDRLGARIICIHFHDNRGVYDDHMDVGAGTVPWQETAAELKRIDYRGPYITECFKTAPHEAIRAFINATANAGDAH